MMIMPSVSKTREGRELFRKIRFLAFRKFPTAKTNSDLTTNTMCSRKCAPRHPHRVITHSYQFSSTITVTGKIQYSIFTKNIKRCSIREVISCKRAPNYLHGVSSRSVCKISILQLTGRGVVGKRRSDVN